MPDQAVVDEAWAAWHDEVAFAEQFVRDTDLSFVGRDGAGRPVSLREPVADRIGSVVVAALTRTVRSLVSELELTPSQDGVPTTCVANFDNLHTLPRDAFRRPVAALSAARMRQACQVLLAATGC